MPVIEIKGHLVKIISRFYTANQTFYYSSKMNAERKRTKRML